ncbi:hypothetical protein D9615_003166 [Tricholomella constricta]|uniref:Uncharacterized protein n=1 Tax=Tricholomella constricta TaxID=117010 RepID=A0A8H5M858_9AGAR|nr:hypothetical protein D9615_003166 [Tricholomella constricta]
MRIMEWTRELYIAVQKPYDGKGPEILDGTARWPYYGAVQPCLYGTVCSPTYNLSDDDEDDPAQTDLDPFGDAANEDSEDE